MDETGRFFMSPRELYAGLGTGSAPILLDVRPAAAFDADIAMLVGAIRRAPDDVGRWASTLSRERLIVP